MSAAYDSAPANPFAGMPGPRMTEAGQGRAQGAYAILSRHPNS